MAPNGDVAANAEFVTKKEDFFISRHVTYMRYGCRQVHYTISVGKDTNQ